MPSYPGSIFGPTNPSGNSPRTAPTSPATLVTAINAEIVAIETAAGINLTHLAQTANNGSDFADAGSTRANLHVPVLTSCKAVATANLTLSGTQTVDGYAAIVGDQILCTAQTTGSQNGPWVVASGAWTRPTDYATGLAIGGRQIQVNGGTVYGGSLWVMLTTTTVTVDTTATTWAQANRTQNDGRYAQRADIPSYNMEAAYFPNLRKMVANVRSGAVPGGTILCAGDSITAGDGTPNVATQSVPAILTAMLAANGTPAVQSLSIPTTDISFDPRWTPGSGWAQVDLGFAVLGGYYASVGAAGNLSFTPGVNCDTFDVYYALETNGATAQINIDGGTNTPVNMNGSPTIQKVTLTATAGTGHTLNIGTITGTAGNIACILGVDPYLSTAPALRVGNAGVGGANTTGWAHTGVTHSTQMIQTYGASLAIFSCGINDSYAGSPLSVSQYIANMTATIQAFQANGCDVLLWTEPPSSTTSGYNLAVQAQYWAACYQIAQSLGCGLVDINARFGSWVEANSLGFMAVVGGGFAGQVHPNYLGNLDIAAAIYDALSSIIGAPPVPTVPTASPLTANTQSASTAYADAGTAVEKARALAAEGALQTTVTGAAQKSSNLSDLASASTARTSLGLGTAATHAATDFDASGSAFPLSTTSEAAISGTTVMTSADIGLNHACTCSSAYQVTLPTPVGSTGKLIGVRVVPSSTNLVTLATAAGNIDGLSTRIMWAGESAILESDGTNWVKLAGKSIPMKCSLSQAGAQSINSASFTVLKLDTTRFDNTGLMAVALASNEITIVRPGAYLVIGSPSLNQAPANSARCISLVLKGGTSVIEKELSALGGAWPQFHAIDEITFAVADVVSLEFYHAAGSAWAVAAGSTVVTPTLTVQEIPAW